MTTSAFKAFPDDYLSNPDAAEQRVLQFWRDARVFENQQSRRVGAKPFVFYEGPPTANGKPGIHHVFARAIKDAVCRYQWMLGARVDRKAGWDTHGLPVELEVEKKLGISGKRQIEEIGIEKFNELCKESVFAYLKDWRELSERMGYWLDYDHPYITFDPRYIESIWYIFSRFHKQGLLEKRFKVIPYCPRCGTGLSSHEVGQGYKDVQDPSVTVRFPLVQEPGTSLLVWTTTPWTLPGNAGAAVHPEMEYVKVKSPKHPGEMFWVAKARAAAVVPNAEIVETRAGSGLVGIRYVPPFDMISGVPDLRTKPRLEAAQKTHTVLPGSFVTSVDGTGIVHMAPCYGADDYELGEREGLPILAPVGRDGRTAIDISAVPRGTFFKDADAGLMTALKESGRLYQRATTQHNYPFCWRCDTALLYYASPSWFLKTTEFRDAMVAGNRAIQWSPPEIGSGRFGEWLEGNIDWAVSRDRYWGTPLPVWECAACNGFDVIESIDELRRRAKQEIPKDFDPHKPGIDKITIPCGQCGAESRRSSSVVDCWFDSGAMPFAQHGWPFTEESRRAVRDQFPSHFIAEGLDQTRGWFYTLHAIATFLTCHDSGRERDGEDLTLPGSGAYKSVVVNGLVLDAQGRKMSKRLGNAVNPFEAMQKNGADAVRLLLLGSGALHLSRRFDPDAMSSLRRQVILPLANCLQFFVTYANECAFDPSVALKEGDLTLLDRWIRSRTTTLAQTTGACLDRYDLPSAIAALGEFADSELSNWYVRRNRKRFQFGTPAERAAGLFILRDALSVAARCLAPIAPFAAEMLWHRIHPRGHEPESVHLQVFPTLDAGRNLQYSAALEESMGGALVVARLARALREKNKIRNTIPLPSINVLVPRMAGGSDAFATAVVDIVKDEVNVDVVSFEFYPPVEGQAHFFELRAKPNFQVLGRKAGKHMKLAQQKIEALPDAELKQFMNDRRLVLDLAGTPLEITLDDVVLSAEVRDAACETDGRITVGLNLTIEPERLARALAREFASEINQARRGSGFKLSDRCKIVVIEGPATARLLAGIDFGGGRARWLEEARASEIVVSAMPPEGGVASRAVLLDQEPVEFFLQRS